MGLDSLKKKVGGETKSKSKTPVITLTGQDASTLKEITQLVEDIKNKEAELEGKKADLTPAADRHRVDLCLRDQQLHASIKLTAQDGRYAATFVRPDNYCKMKAADCEDRLQAILGKLYDKYCTKKRVVNIKLDSLSEAEIDKVCSALEKTLGDKLADVVGVEETIRPTETWTHDAVFNAEITAMSKRLQGEGLMVPFKPSFKV